MLKLVIGNKNYSSWSMRPWVLLQHFQVEFEEVRIPLFMPGYQDRLAVYSPTLKVPVLVDGELTVWDSLAICEYVNDKVLRGAALPADLARRARCRAYCAEMHGGFFQLRNQLPMNCKAQRRVDFSLDLQEDIDRVEALWSQARAANGDLGPYLFGDFSMADAFFAPVAMRFLSYQVSLPGAAGDYLATLSGNPAVQAWVDAALVEREVLSDFEVGQPIRD